jgi:hypothetical protein
MKKIQILVKGSTLDAMGAAAIRLPRGVRAIPKETTFGATRVNVYVPAARVDHVERVLAQWFCEPGEPKAGIGYPDWTLLHYSDQTGERLDPR